VASTSGERSDYFPAIEKKYGQPMSYWFEVMKDISGQKYPEQMAYLQNNYGFTRTHANALVLYSRGSTTSRRYSSLRAYLDELDPVKRATVETILRAVQSKYPTSEIVMAWNQPMMRYRGQYVFGVSVAAKHILIAPFNADVIKKFTRRLRDYKVNKKTIQVPVDWEVDTALLRDMVTACVATLAKA
jgi:uncharacterized protein YdhG (YjbR/CyaY superfamily)